MKHTAYHRVSDKDQHLDRGIAEINAFCGSRGITLYKNKVYTDKQTGKNFDRPQYMILKQEVLEPGDTLIITEIDRLARNKPACMNELQYYKDNGIRVMVLELPTTLMDTPQDNEMARMMFETINNMMIELYASMAHAEMLKREKRQREGLDAKRARGEWADMGRPCVMPLDKFRKHYAAVERGEKTKAQLQRELGLKHSTFFNYCRNIKVDKENSK